MSITIFLAWFYIWLAQDMYTLLKWQKMSISVSTNILNSCTSYTDKIFFFQWKYEIELFFIEYHFNSSNKWKLWFGIMKKKSFYTIARACLPRSLHWSFRTSELYGSLSRPLEGFESWGSPPHPDSRFHIPQFQLLTVNHSLKIGKIPGINTL